MRNRMNNDDQEEGNDDMLNDQEEIEVLTHELVQCPACQRRMRSEVFSKHPNVCKENPNKKRQVRVFDMTRYRSIKAGDKIVPVQKISPTDTNKTNNINNPRPSQTRSAKRNRRINTVVPPVINNFTCPNCKRSFCEKAYERHAQFCSNKSKQLPQPPTEETLLARLKLDRRVKFNTNRVPSTLSNTAPNPISIPSNKTTKTETIRFLSMHKNRSDSLARCPWCSKPYLPNCVHYCRNSKDLFSIQSK